MGRLGNDPHFQGVATATPEIQNVLRRSTATVQGESIERTHALAWLTSSPARRLFRDIADEIRELVKRNLSDDLRDI